MSKLYFLGVCVDTHAQQPTFPYVNFFNPFVSPHVSNLCVLPHPNTHFILSYFLAKMINDAELWKTNNKPLKRLNGLGRMRRGIPKTLISHLGIKIEGL